MNRMKQKLLLVLFCLMATVSKAQFTIDYPYTEKQDVNYTLYFVTNIDGANTVTINQSYFPYSEYKTELVIPKEVKYGGQTYTVRE